MNYLTNYYKNLSEKLQHRVNTLESQARMINEAMTSYNVYGNRPSAMDTAAMGGGAGIPGDYNGDGRVDGYDLGIALGNYGQPGYNYQSTLQNWTGNMSNAGPAFRSTAAPSSNRNKSGVGMAAADSDAASGSYIQGDYNGDGRVDGADLGIALGNYGQPGYNYQTTLQNWTTPVNNAGPAFRSTAAPSAGRGRNMARGVEGMDTAPGAGIPGDYNGDGRVDGADLGIALGNYGQPGYNQNTVLNNWTGPVNNAGPATYRATPATARQRIRRG